MNEQDIIAKLVRWQRRKFPLVEGRLNNHAYILLRAFNRYGVSRTAAEQYIVGVLGHHCDLTDLRQLVANAYQHTDEHGTKVFDGSSRRAPQPQPRQANPRFSLSPSQLARLAQWQQQDQQLRSAPSPVLPPPPITSRTPSPVEGVTSSTGVTVSEPVTTSTDCKEQARATPPSGTAAEAFNRWAALNPALNTLSQALDLDLSNAVFGASPAEQDRAVLLTSARRGWTPQRVIVSRVERGHRRFLVAIVRDPVLRLDFGNRSDALLLTERAALEALNAWRTIDRTATPCSLVYL